MNIIIIVLILFILIILLLNYKRVKLVCSNMLGWNVETPNKEVVKQPKNNDDYLRQVFDRMEPPSFEVFGSTNHIDVKNMFCRKKNLSEMDADIKKTYPSIQRIHGIEKEKAIEFINESIADATTSTKFKVIDPEISFYSVNTYEKDYIIVFCAILYNKSIFSGAKIAGVIYCNRKGEYTLKTIRMVNDERPYDKVLPKPDGSLEWGVLGEQNVLGKVDCGVPESLDSVINNLK